MVHSPLMAEIRPFRAVQYDYSRLPIEKLVTQPYDKITREMRERYLAAHPENLVRVLRPLDNTDVPPGVSPYRHAAGIWENWRRTGIVRAIDQPAIFPYYQRFTVPGGREPLTRKGFVALVRLADYSSHVIFPHERTLSGPRTDRLELLRHTRTHFGQVFLLYSDPECRIERWLDESGPRAGETVRDEFDVEHTLWMVAEPEPIAAIRDALSSQRLLIADGHHRYETALAFRDEERARNPGGDAGDFEWLMATLVNMDGGGLVILPTHRVLSGLPDFDPAGLIERARDFYDVAELGDGGRLISELSRYSGSRPAIGLASGKGRYALLVLRERSGPADLLEDMSPAQASLDVVLLHRLILKRCLGLTEEAIRQESYVRYVRDARAALAEVDTGPAQVAFLLNPTPLRAVRDIAFAGGVLPQKSTDFYPKLLSGLVMYSGS